MLDIQATLVNAKRILENVWHMGVIRSVPITESVFVGNVSVLGMQIDIRGSFVKTVYRAQRKGKFQEYSIRSTNVAHKIEFFIHRKYIF